MININFSITYTELYLLFINLLTFIIYGIDKFKSIQNNKSIMRISESTLLLFTFIGGVIGAGLSMVLFKHKIKKLSFVVKFVVIVVFQIIVYYYGTEYLS